MLKFLYNQFRLKCFRFHLFFLVDFCVCCCDRSLIFCMNSWFKFGMYRRGIGRVKESQRLLWSPKSRKSKLNLIREFLIHCCCRIIRSMCVCVWNLELWWVF
jgi:hypothetical protein